VVTVSLTLPGALRPYAGNRASLEVEVGEPPATVGDLLGRLSRTEPALERRLRDERGQLRRHVNVFVDGINVRDTGLLDTPLPEGAEVSVIAAVSGG
jgi:sulfur-carrier protein